MEIVKCDQGADISKILDIGKQPKTVQHTESGWLPTDQCCKQLHNVVATVSSLVLLLHQPQTDRDRERESECALDFVNLLKSIPPLYKIQ